MQKLQISLKLLSEIPKQLCNRSSLIECNPCKSFIDSLGLKYPKHNFSSSVKEPHFGFNSSSTTSSWRSHYRISEKKVSGFSATNPLLVRKFFSNARVKVQSLNVCNRVVLFGKLQSSRGQYKINAQWLNHWKSWLPSADNVVLGLVATNVAVFGLWRIANPTFMKENFMISVENITSGRIHTLITSAFSHMELQHLFANMIGLYFFGGTIGQMFGPQFVLQLYLAGAVGGSIFYLIRHTFMAPQFQGSGMWYVDPKKIPALGASGAVNAIMLLDIFLFPKAIHYVNLFIPVPAMLLGAFLIGNDLWRMKEGNSHISGEAHLGGALVAALAWARIKKRWI